MFDFAMGNPPYQESPTDDSKSFMPQIYHKFLDMSYEIAGKSLQIHPGRFLFNAGSTPVAWNKKMLENSHFAVMEYNPNSASVFTGDVGITGGIAVTYYDKDREFDPIIVYTAFPELRSILIKVKETTTFESFSTIVANRGLYRFSDLVYIDYPDMMSQFTDSRISPSAFDKLSTLFMEEKPVDKYEYVRVYGILDGQRVYRWFRQDYMNFVDGFDKWKVFVPKANGSGAIGEGVSTTVIGPPVVGDPGVGHTESFLTIGCFDTENEACACLKYIKSRFARLMLGILKVTQNSSSKTYELVPLQDFTIRSDIDWSQSIFGIDQQLYMKYGLDDNEIAFIESHIKEME